MNLLNEVRDYIEYIKKNTYIFSLQKQGLELLLGFNEDLKHSHTIPKGYVDALDYFLAVWVPKHKKYLKVEEAFNIAYTVQDLLTFIHKKYNSEDNTPIVLDYYGEEYLRVYKVNEIVRKMVGDPIISMTPTIIDLESYREYRDKQQHRDSMAMYEQGLFRVEEINDEGYIALSKINGQKYCKVLMRRDWMYNFKVDDILHVTLKRKIFFIYWEIEELKAYYPSKAAQYL
ncbi:hypothetical protein PBV87_03160 [Niameybacter massiliensis]|uniref:Uncharacterized protein n=1 Tax=Holtiella tumoricola TaxID=3018743 RepID=A0AA42IZN3_9FIRM|nr:MULTISPECIES: hypothetical protein [Lachnospirales]MDA3730505.1 hypothetical protein [Holtiella tumoricola]